VNRRFLALLAVVLVLGAGVLTGVFRQLGVARRQFAAEATLAREHAEFIRSTVVVYSELKVTRGLTFSEALDDLGIEPVAAADIVSSVRGVFDLRQIRPGNPLEIGRSADGELRDVRYRIDAENMLSVRPNENGFEAAVQPIPSRTEMMTVRGEIRDSLFGAVDETGEGPELAMRLAEIFGWDLDFYNDPRQGDTFRVQVEKKTSLDGKSRTYGRVLFAEYVNDGHPYQALLFRNAAGKPAYYSPDGRSLEKAFLRSPLKFSAAVTSGFSRSRFHPVLHTQRAHLGVDYRAPVGTPVQAIGSGRVVFAGYRGGNGNMVHLRHTNGYETQYLHLSRILVRSGQRVEAGERVGLVGSTGLATGPHLHFSVLQHGAHRNFEVLRRNLPSAEPVARGDMAEFVAVKENVMAQLGVDALAARGGEAAEDSSATTPIRPASLR
jgi:murein DD-endopeptidase MepM/ murein hydrolase activator NlpD